MQKIELNKYFGLKWNPFLAEIPAESLLVTQETEFFINSVENLAFEGGFAMLSGEPGTGKSAILRLVHNHFKTTSDVAVRTLQRPQSGIRDFYSELGDLFEIPLKQSNRFSGFKNLRTEWSNHINKSLFRSILIVDEAQTMPEETLSELRILSSSNLDSKNILGIVLAGDEQLIKRLSKTELLPLKSRVKIGMHLKSMSQETLVNIITHNLNECGAPPDLFEPIVISNLCKSSSGNLRACMNIFYKFLSLAHLKGVRKIDLNFVLTVSK